MLGAPALGELLHASARASHDDGAEVAHAFQQGIVTGDAEVVVGIDVLTGEHGIEELVVDVLVMHECSWGPRRSLSSA